MPGSRKHPWWLVKGHRSYTPAEIADLLGCKRPTVWGWIRDERLKSVGRYEGSQLVYGEDLIAFLRAARGKVRCPPGSMYCLKCRAARCPKGIVEFRPFSSSAGMLEGRCEECGNRMYRRVSKEKAQEVMSGVSVRFLSGHERIADAESLPSVSNSGTSDDDPPKR